MLVLWQSANLFHLQHSSGLVFLTAAAGRRNLISDSMPFGVYNFQDSNSSEEIWWYLLEIMSNTVQLSMIYISDWMK